PTGTLFHPTFLYELLWNLAAAAILIAVDRRWRLGHGRVFWLYVAFYTAGRSWIEMLRIDTAEHILACASTYGSRCWCSPSRSRWSSSFAARAPGKTAHGSPAENPRKRKRKPRVRIRFGNSLAD